MFAGKGAGDGLLADVSDDALDDAAADVEDDANDDAAVVPVCRPQPTVPLPTSRKHAMSTERRNTRTA